MNDITRQTILIFLMYTLFTAAGLYLIFLSHTTIKQFFFCCVGLALLQPISDFILLVIKDIFK